MVRRQPAYLLLAWCNVSLLKFHSYSFLRFQFLLNNAFLLVITMEEIMEFKS